MEGFNKKNDLDLRKKEKEPILINSNSTTTIIKEEAGEKPKEEQYTKNEFTVNTHNNSHLLSSWSEIDIKPLLSIGFSKIQLRQLQDRNTPEIIQKSIYHFAYGLEHNEKTKKYKDNALSVFMGVLRKGQAWTETNYKSPQQLALEKLIEDKKKETEQCNQKLDELTELEFPAWKQELTEQKIKEIVPETFRLTRVPQDVVEYLKKYFKETVLTPRLKKEEILI